MKLSLSDLEQKCNSYKTTQEERKNLIDYVLDFKTEKTVDLLLCLIGNSKPTAEMEIKHKSGCFTTKIKVTEQRKPISLTFRVLQWISA